MFLSVPALRSRRWVRRFPIYCGFKHLERNGIVPLGWARRSEGLRSPKRRMEGSWAGQLRCLSLALWSEAYVVYLTRFSFIFWSGERK